MADAGFFKAFPYNLFLPIGYKLADLSMDGVKPNTFWKFMGKLAEAALFHPLKDKVGLSRARCAITGGAMISPDIFRFFRAIGVRLVNFLGASEAGIVIGQSNEEARMDSIGRPLAGAEVRIASDGEMLLKGPLVFIGYYKDPEKTKEALTDGWFHTGDAAYIDERDGHIIYVDRIADLMELSEGRKYSPQFIEGRLKFSPYIRDAVVLGGGEDRPYPVVLVQIDYDIVGRWAERNHIPYTTFTDLSQKPQVYDLVEKDLNRVNRSLPEGSRVKKFICLQKELDPDEAELTRTRKLRRDYLERKYGDITKAIYEDKKEFIAKSEVKYRDGRKGTVTTAVTIRNLF